MAAQAAIHASVHVCYASETTPTLKRVVGARLRGHDVERATTAAGASSCRRRAMFHAAGTPEDVAATKESYTGQYLRDLLGRRARPAGGRPAEKSGKRQAAE